MKKFAKVLSLLLAFAMFSSTTSFAANVPTPQEKMTDICLVSTEDYFVVVSVPESKAAAYQERLASDREFFQAQLQEATRSSEFSEYPGYPGRVVSEQYMYLSDIEREINNTKQQADYFSKWMRDIRGVVTVAKWSRFLKSTAIATGTKLATYVFNALFSWARQHEEDWWLEAQTDIINGRIRAVKYVIIENVTEYPKIWRIFVRV